MLREHVAASESRLEYCSTSNELERAVHHPEMAVDLLVGRLFTALTRALIVDANEEEPFSAETAARHSNSPRAHYQCQHAQSRAQEGADHSTPTEATSPHRIPFIPATSIKAAEDRRVEHTRIQPGASAKSLKPLGDQGVVSGIVQCASGQAYWEPDLPV